MNEMTLRLAISLAALAIWTVQAAYFMLKIRKEKKQHQNTPKAPANYVSVLVLSLAVILLPYLIWFEQLYVMVILEGCGILGPTVVFRERLETLKKQN